MKETMQPKDYEQFLKLLIESPWDREKSLEHPILKNETYKNFLSGVSKKGYKLDIKLDRGVVALYLTGQEPQLEKSTVLGKISYKSNEALFTYINCVPVTENREEYKCVSFEVELLGRIHFMRTVVEREMEKIVWREAMDFTRKPGKQLVKFSKKAKEAIKLIDKQLERLNKGKKVTKMKGNKAVRLSSNPFCRIFNIESNRPKKIECLSFLRRQIILNEKVTGKEVEKFSFAQLVKDATTRYPTATKGKARSRVAEMLEKIEALDGNKAALKSRLSISSEYSN